MNHVFFKCLALSSLLIVHTCQSQELKTGDALPALVIPDVINYTDNVIKLAELRGKHIVFDFWTTNCPACLTAFPKLDSLQKKYKEKLQIILVTPQKKKVIEDFFAKRKKLFKPNLPMVTGDEAIYNLFPRKERPYAAWADNKGILQYVTTGGYVAEGYVNSFVQNIPIAVSQLEGIKTYYKSIMREELEDDVFYMSCISKFNPAYRSGNKNGLAEGKLAVMSNDNASVAELFIKAYRGEKYAITPARFRIQLQDTFKYVRPSTMERYDEWLDNHCYTYELRLPESRKSELHDIMQEDLKRFFKIDIKVEKWKIKCLVLRRVSDSDILKTKGGEPIYRLADDNPIQPKEDTIRYLQNKPFKSLATAIQAKVEYQAGIPFMDETGYNGNIDILLRVKSLQPLNLDNLKKDLKKYGLELNYEDRETEMYILKKL